MGRLSRNLTPDKEVHMGTRWIMPVVCYALLIAAEIFAVGSTLLPQTNPFAFVGLHLFIPALSLLLALLLSAAGTNLLLKLLFPIVALAVMPFCYLLSESKGASAVDLNHLSADFGLALIFVFAPAVLGTIIGLIVSAVGARRQKRLAASRNSSLAKKTQATGSAGARAGYSTGARRNTGEAYRAGYRAGTSGAVNGNPKLRVVSAARTGSSNSSGKSTTRKKKKRSGTTAYLSGNSRL
jgi:hypothetical protein